LLLSFEDLDERFAADARFRLLRIGDGLSLESASAPPVFERLTPALQRSPQPRHEYGPSVAWEALCAAATERCARVRKGFSLLSSLLPPLGVEVEDLGRVLVLDAARGPREGELGSAHIAAHSRALDDWLGRRFGDDTFFAGAHFALRDRDSSAIQRWALVTLLEASHLDPRSALRYLGSREGLRFLWCRREELLTSLSPGALRAAQMRL
jgi:hypothetical protein